MRFIAFTSIDGHAVAIQAAPVFKVETTGEFTAVHSMHGGQPFRMLVSESIAQVLERLELAHAQNSAEQTREEKA